MTNKEKYYSFCEQVSYVPIFYRPAWWEQLSKDWEVIHFSQFGTDYFLPFIKEKKMGFTFIRNPHLTPYSALFYDFERNLSEAELTDAWKSAMNLLPNVSEIELDCYPNTFPITEGCTTKITHLLALSTEEEIYASFKSSLRRQLKKAQKNLTWVESNDLTHLLKMHTLSLDRQGAKSYLDLKLAKKLFDYSLNEKDSRLYYAKDYDGNMHAGLWVVHDNHNMYYLLGGSAPDFLGSGAMGFLLWESIKYAMLLGLKQFDFEGSSVPSIARFFKGFSAQEIVFPVLRKEPTKILSALKKIKKA